MKALFERHPLPWKIEGPDCDYYWVRDAKGATVLMVSDADETHSTTTNDQGHVVRTTIKTKRPGADKLAAAIAALPEMETAMADAYRYIKERATDPDQEHDREIAARLESLIERLA